MKKNIVILSVILLAVFATIALAAVPHYWGSSSGDHAAQQAVHHKGSDNHKVSHCEYDHGHGGRNCDD